VAKSSIPNRVAIAGLAAGIFFPLAGQIQRPVRETVTPAVLQKTVWAGANLKSFPQGSDALRVLAEVKLTAKQVRRITEQFGQDRLCERSEQVADFREKPLMERLTSPAAAAPPALGVVMLDGGRYQRRDHFGEENYDGSHWKEDKVGLVLHMDSEVHDRDPHPEFPEWLAHAEVVAEIAALGAPDEEKHSLSHEDSGPLDVGEHVRAGWDQLTPQLLSRDVIASSECGEDFGHHLEFAAWQQGVIDAPRMAFVADGASVNWTIHKQHFSQMTGILDLMHALSYAWKAARALGDTAAYQCYATWIWQGNVAQVIDELTRRRSTFRVPPGEGPIEDPVQRAITYYTNHRHRMNYPQYRQLGLPLTSSHIESTIKLMNIRMKGSQKFFRQDTGETLLQLRADSLSDSAPLKTFWPRWLKKQTGANSYRKQPA
jgi:hypothetical protein